LLAIDRQPVADGFFTVVVALYQRFAREVVYNT